MSTHTPQNASQLRIITPSGSKWNGKNACFKQNTLKPPRKETLMHEEHAGDRPILVNFLHHGITALAVTLLAHAVATAAVMLAGSPVGPVVHALARALGGGLATSAVGGTSRRCCDGRKASTDRNSTWICHHNCRHPQFRRSCSRCTPGV